MMEEATPTRWDAIGIPLVQTAIASPRLARARAVDDTRRVGDALLARVAAGDRIAFASLYDHLSSAAYGLAQRVVRDPALAEEITQDAFLQAWSTGPTYDRTCGSARNWVLTIVHRRAVDMLRHDQAAHERVLRVDAGSVEPPFDTGRASALQRSERDRVLVALSSVAASRRQAVELAYFEGMTCHEVATRLEIPVGTARSRIYKGVRRLRRALIAADR